MDIVQVFKQQKIYEQKLDKNIENLFKLDNFSIIDSFAIEILKLFYENKVIKLILTKNSNIENYELASDFIRYFHTIVYTKLINEDMYLHNIFVMEFNKAINNKNIYDIFTNILDNLYNIENQNSDILNLFKDILKFELIEKDINKENFNKIKINFKNKINSNLNDLQNIILNNMSIIHDSLETERNLIYNTKITHNRYNSYPKRNKYPYIINQINKLNNKNNENIKNFNYIPIKNKNEEIRNGICLDSNKILEYKNNFKENSIILKNFNDELSKYNINYIKNYVKINKYDDKDSKNLYFIIKFRFLDDNHTEIFNMNNKLYKNEIIIDKSNNKIIENIKYSYEFKENSDFEENFSFFKKNDEK